MINMDNGLRRSRILILDDNDDILEMLRELLTNEGYEVKTFTSVSDIIQLTEETKPSLVLLDYLLAGINGGEYCHQLKKHPLTSHIPIIMLSAHQRVIESLGNYGWDAFIAKPFDVDSLTATISELLKVSAETCSPY